MMGYRCLVAINLLLTCATYVKAQWILDNRCSSRRLQQQELGYDRNEDHPRESFDQLDNISDTTTRNATDNEDVFWYQNLRGHRQPTPTSQSSKTTAATKSRDLFQEDPSSFMMRMHWQPGNCWQGKTGL